MICRTWFVKKPQTGTVFGSKIQVVKLSPVFSCLACFLVMFSVLFAYFIVCKYKNLQSSHTRTKRQRLKVTVRTSLFRILVRYITRIKSLLASEYITGPKPMMASRCCNHNTAFNNGTHSFHRLDFKAYSLLYEEYTFHVLT
jgi:hypothetical protein